MFLGTHTPKLDDKGRLTLPAKFRDELARGLVITKGQDRCLYVFPRRGVRPDGTARSREAPLTNEAVRDLPALPVRRASDESAGRAGPRSPSRPSCAATPGWPRTAWSSARSPASRSGTRRPGSATWTSTRRPSRQAPRRCCPDCSVDSGHRPTRVPSGLRSARLSALAHLPRRQVDGRAGTRRASGRRPDTRRIGTVSHRPTRRGASGNRVWKGAGRDRHVRPARAAQHVPVLLDRVVELLAPALAGRPPSRRRHAGPGRARRGAARRAPGS